VCTRPLANIARRGWAVYVDHGPTEVEEDDPVGLR